MILIEYKLAWFKVIMYEDKNNDRFEQFDNKDQIKFSLLLFEYWFSYR